MSKGGRGDFWKAFGARQADSSGCGYAALCPLRLDFGGEMKKVLIQEVRAREIINGRGIPAVEAEIFTSTGGRYIASSPSGVSTSSHEAIEIRDGGKRMMGKGVQRAVGNILKIIGPAIAGMDITDQGAIDRRILEIDGTPNKSKLGGNAVTAVSLVVARAGAASAGLPLYRYIGGSKACSLPVVCPNMISGSKTAGNEIDFEDHLIVPFGFPNVREAIFAGVEVFHALHQMLEDAFGLIPQITALAPPLKTTEEALQFISRAIAQCGYEEKIGIGIDAAANHFYDEASDRYKLRKGTMTRDDLIAYYATLAQSYPIFFLEDGLQEDDFEGFGELTRRLDCLVVGDDLFATNKDRLILGAEKYSLNGALFKLNQAGTVSEFLEAAEIAKRHHYTIVGSVRSGETEDAGQADLAVVIGANYFKLGAPVRGEMITKYNQFLRIEEDLGDAATFQGKKDRGIRRKG
jgi:enolase